MSFRDDFPVYCMMMEQEILALADKIRAARQEPKRGTPTQGPPKKRPRGKQRRTLARSP